MNPLATLVLIGALAPAPTLPERPLTPDDCVRIALDHNAQIAEAEARVAGLRALLAEVQSNYGPRLTATAYLAPMFTVHGSALAPSVDYAYGLGDWGPYTHLEALLAQPLYSFGRIEAGERAAAGRVAVEQARVRATEALVATEVRRLYSTVLYARSMLPALGVARRSVDGALAQAEAMYAAGEGVTQVDLGKLQYGQSEVIRLTRTAEDGAELAFDALRHTMGLPRSVEFALAWQRLPDPEPLPTLPEALAAAAERRPEWVMTERGLDAALSLEQAERLADAPVLFVGGTLNLDWAPTRDDAANPYHNDPYNQVTGGVAIGVQWDFQPLRTAARAEGARALADEVRALRAFAETGIPLEVRRAHQDATRFAALLDVSRQGVTASRRWLTFAAAAWQTGTGGANDVLEGLVSWLSAKQTHYDHLRRYHDARAELARVTGGADPRGESP